jgi:hypothetical protein
MMNRKKKYQNTKDLCDKACQQWLGIGQWFSPGTTVSTTNKTDRHVGFH